MSFGCNEKMDSFHVDIDSSLTSPENASLFSFPLEMKPHKNRTVAVTKFTCPKTVLLETNELCISYPNMSEHRVLSAKKPTKIMLRALPTLKDVLAYIQVNFKKLLQVTFHKGQCQWKVIHSNYVVVLSNPLRHAVKLWQDVLTPWDKAATNCTAVDYDSQLPLGQYLIFVPISFNHVTYEIKEKHEAYTCSEFLSVIGKHIGVTYDNSILRMAQPDVPQLYIFSEPLHTLLPFNQAGTWTSPLRRHWNGECNIDSVKTYEIYVYNLSDMETFDSAYDASHGNTSVCRAVRRPRNSAEYVHFVKRMSPLFEKGDTISLRYDERVVIEMNDMTHKLVLGDEFRDILGFDEASFEAPNTYVSQRPISAGFHRIFIHSSLVGYTPLGRRQERLLFALPLDHTGSIQPTPVRVMHKQKETKQIEFSLRNEKGEPIVFPYRSTTHLRLTFQQ